MPDDRSWQSTAECAPQPVSSLEIVRSDITGDKALHLLHYMGDMITKWLLLAANHRSERVSPGSPTSITWPNLVMWLDETLTYGSIAYKSRDLNKSRDMPIYGVARLAWKRGPNRPQYTTKLD